MSDEELEIGSLSYNELIEKHASTTGHPLLDKCPCPVADEVRERDGLLSMRNAGKPGASPLLSRRVVRAVIGTSYVAARERGQRCSEMGNMHGAQYEAGFAAGMDFVARWLLALPLDAPSTLEDPE